MGRSKKSRRKINRKKQHKQNINKKRQSRGKSSKPSAPVTDLRISVFPTPPPEVTHVPVEENAWDKLAANATPIKLATLAADVAFTEKSFVESAFHNGEVVAEPINVTEVIDNHVKIKDIYPIPEIFEGDLGKDWKVRASSRASLDYSKKILRVPLDASATSHCSVMHEIGHIKWSMYTDSQLKAIGADIDVWKAIEDRRVNHLLVKNGIDLSAGTLKHDEKDEIGYKLMSQDERMQSLVAIASHGTGDYSFIKDIVSNEQIHKLCQDIDKQLSEDSSPESCIRITKWVSAILQKSLAERKSEEGPKKSNFGGKGSVKDKATGSAKHVQMSTASSPKAEDEILDMIMETMEGFGEDQKLMEIPQGVRKELPKTSEYKNTPIGAQMQNLNSKADGFIPWGKLIIEEPNRTESLKGSFHKRWKATEEGVLPRYPHRYFIDKQIFANKKRIPGGTVIVDGSGSMGLTPDMIKEIVNLAPGCQVAVYGGLGTTGILRILAKDGRCVPVSLCKTPGGQNNVDFPALQWAMKLSHPRIWVTDGIVTGVNDMFAKKNTTDCFAASVKGKFFVVPNLREAKKILKKLGRHYKR